MMKVGTKIALSCAALIIGGLALILMHEWLSHEIKGEKKPLPSPITVAHANKAFHNYDVRCVPFGDPPVSEKELDEPGSFYTVTFTQDFKVVNRTESYMKFTMTCDVLAGPSREAEKRGIAEQVVAPNSVVAYAKVKIHWPRAFKTDNFKKFHYACGCTAEVVERPLKTFMMPFVPDNR
jgi:hypothetical protein